MLRLPSSITIPVGRNSPTNSQLYPIIEMEKGIIVTLIRDVMTKESS